jgi:hypothetical protein
MAIQLSELSQLVGPKESCNDRRMTTMLDEQFARVRTHSNNIARYRGLLKTNLTDQERQFIERRLSEEQSEFERLSADILTRYSEGSERSFGPK